MNEVEEMAQLVKDWENQLPPWAVRLAQHGILEVGAQLPTKDGRRTGNGTIVMASSSKLETGRQYYSVLTDAGSSMILNSSEVFEMFHPPKYIVDVKEAIAKFDRNGEFSGPDPRGQPTD